MATRLTVHIRVTRGYVDEYSHLDTWGRRFDFKILGGERLVHEGNWYDDLGSRRYRVIGSKHIDQGAQATALRDLFSFSGCSHSYDCCGCLSSIGRVQNVKPGVFSVLVSKSRNF